MVGESELQDNSTKTPGGHVQSVFGSRRTKCEQVRDGIGTVHRVIWQLMRTKSQLQSDPSIARQGLAASGAAATSSTDPRISLSCAEVRNLGYTSGWQPQAKG